MSLTTGSSRRAALGAGRLGEATAPPRPVAPADPATARRRDATGGGPSYLPAIDGLRAVAVTVVVAYHLGRLGGGFVGVDLFFVISGFLITRNLLAERARDGRVSLRSFWRRRFRRLVPPLLVVVAATAVASWALLPSWRLAELRTDALAAIGYVANWRFVAGGESYFAPGASPLRHTWSLAVEEQFYVLWPLVAVAALAFAGRRAARSGAGRHPDGARVVAVVAGVLTVASATWMAVVAGWGDPSRTYYGTDTRLFALTAGAAAAALSGPLLTRVGTPGDERRARRAARTAVVALVLLVPFALWASASSTAFARGGFQAVALLSVVAVLGLASGSGAVVVALGHPALTWVGRRSYGIYLWSWPVQVLLEESTAIRGWSLALLVGLLTVGLAALSYRWVEQPLLRSGHRGSTVRDPADVGGLRGLVGGRDRSSLVLGAATCLTVALVWTVALGAAEAPSVTRLSDDEVLALALAPEEPAPAEPSEPSRPGETDLGAADPSPAEGTATATAPVDPLGRDGRSTPFDPAAPLVVGAGSRSGAAPDPGVRLGVLVAGDSSAWTLGYDLTDDVHEAVRISNRAIIGCGVLPPESGPVLLGRWDGSYPDACREHERSEQIGLDAGPDVALLWIGAWEVYDHQLAGVRYEVGTDAYAELVRSSLQSRIDRYRDHGVPTVLTLVPCFGRPEAGMGEERTDPDRRAWVNDQVRHVAEANPGWVRLVDPAEVLCNADGTPRERAEDGTLLRYDGAHFDRASASWVWREWLADRLVLAFTER